MEQILIPALISAVVSVLFGSVAAAGIHGGSSINQSDEVGPDHLGRRQEHRSRKN
jgi:hypothetical protein